MFRVWRLLRLLLLLALLLSSGAGAQDQARRRVEIVLVGKLGQDPVFAARATSWFRPERFTVGLRRARYLDPRQVLAPAGNADVHVWVTLSGDNLARLYFSSAAHSGRSESYFLRDLRLESGLDEIGAEHVAEVLHLSTQAFLDGQALSAREELERTLQAEPAPTPEPAPPAARPVGSATRPVEELVAPATRRPAARREWGAGVGYGVSYRADEGIWHGPRASLEALLLRRFGLRVAAAGALPQTRELEPLALRFFGASFLVAASFRHALGSRIELEWFAGPGLEVVRYEPVQPPSSDYIAAQAATEARPEAGVGLCASFAGSPRVSVLAEATVPLTKTHYDVVQGSQRRVIGEASPVVPKLGFELGF
jgi:hypothetical protein